MSGLSAPACVSGHSAPACSVRLLLSGGAGTNRPSCSRRRRAPSSSISEYKRRAEKLGSFLKSNKGEERHTSFSLVHAHMIPPFAVDPLCHKACLLCPALASSPSWRRGGGGRGCMRCALMCLFGGTAPLRKQHPRPAFAGVALPARQHALTTRCGCSHRGASSRRWWLCATAPARGC